MKLTFLGTGAAQNAKTPETKIVGRRCSTLMIDDNILIDVSPQSFDFAERLGIDTSKITDVFITHSHGDHFSAEQLRKFALSAGKKINVWCHSGAVANMEIDDILMNCISVNIINIMESVATNGVDVVALPANHGMPNCEQALHFALEKDGRSVFYGCDGAWLFDETWSYMKKHSFDCIILECTVGEHGGDMRLGGHNTMPMVELLATGIRENRVLKENGVIMASHIGNLTHDCVPHEITAEKMARFDVVAAYDGMKVEI